MTKTFNSARNFIKELLEDLRFVNHEIDILSKLSITGPYIDLVVCHNVMTSLSFLKLGYEPIAEYIFGCRMCTNNNLIRQIKIISDAYQPDSFKLERETLIQGKDLSGQYIGKVFYIMKKGN